MALRWHSPFWVTIPWVDIILPSIEQLVYKSLPLGSIYEPGQNTVHQTPPIQQLSPPPHFNCMSFCYFFIYLYTKKLCTDSDLCFITLMRPHSIFCDIQARSTASEDHFWPFSSSQSTLKTPHKPQQNLLKSKTRGRRDITRAIIIFFTFKIFFISKRLE